MKNGESEMKEKLVTLKNLEDITGITENTLRTFLCGFRFTKFVRHERLNGNMKQVFCFNKDFLEALSDFLYLKRKLGAIKCLEKFYKKEVLNYGR